MSKTGALPQTPPGDEAIPRTPALLDPSDRGFLLGDGVFETLAVRATHIRHVDAHLSRLRRGADALRIPLRHTDLQLVGAMRRTLAAQDLADAVIRITLSRGPGPHGLLPPSDPSPTLVITAGALPPPALPGRLIVATVTYRNEKSPLSRMKSLNYLDGILARQEAADLGADDAILLNTAGDAAEATAANLFVFMNNTLVTPPVDDGALPGILRGLLLQAGIATERRIRGADLLQARAGLLGNSLGVRRIAAIDGRALDIGLPALLEAAQAAAGLLGLD